MGLRRSKEQDAGADAARPTSAGLRLTDHPRAQRHIATVKGWAGLVGFVLAALLAHRAGLPVADVLLRGLLVGIGAYLVAWAVAVTVWRQLARAELDHLRRMFEAAHAQAEAEAERRRAERLAAREAEAA